MEEAGVGRKERNLDAARGARSHTDQSQNWVSEPLSSLSPPLLCTSWKKDLCESRLILLHQRADRLKTTIKEN